MTGAPGPPGSGFQWLTASCFLSLQMPPAPEPPRFELPALYRTETTFPWTPERPSVKPAAHLGLCEPQSQSGDVGVTLCLQRLVFLLLLFLLICFCISSPWGLGQQGGPTCGGVSRLGGQGVPSCLLF